MIPLSLSNLVSFETGSDQTYKNAYARTDRHKLHSLLLAIVREHSQLPVLKPLVAGDVLPVNCKSFFTQFYDFWDKASITAAITKLSSGRIPLHRDGLIPTLFEILIKKRIWLNDFENNRANNRSNALDHFIDWFFSEYQRLDKAKKIRTDSLDGLKQDFIQKIKGSELCIYYVSPLSNQMEVLFSHDGTGTHDYRELLAKSGFYLTKHEANIQISSLVLKHIWPLKSAVILLLDKMASLFNQNNEELDFYNTIIATKDKVSSLDPRKIKCSGIKYCLPRVTTLLQKLETLTDSSSLDRLLAAAMSRIINYILGHVKHHKIYVFIINCITNELGLFLDKRSGFIKKVRCLQNIQELLYM